MSNSVWSKKIPGEDGYYWMKHVYAGSHSIKRPVNVMRIGREMAVAVPDSFIFCQRNRAAMRMTKALFGPKIEVPE